MSVEQMPVQEQPRVLRVETEPDGTLQIHITITFWTLRERVVTITDPTVDVAAVLRAIAEGTTGITDQKELSGKLLIQEGVQRREVGDWACQGVCDEDVTQLIQTLPGVEEGEEHELYDDDALEVAVTRVPSVT
jgi:hypothetical protein